MNIGDTIRIKTDNPSYSDVKAGTTGVVIEVLHEGDEIACRARVGGRTWGFMEADVEVIDVGATFKGLTRDLGSDILFGEIEDLYDAPTVASPLPVAVEQAPEPVAAAGEDDGEDCPVGPHAHTMDGEVVPLPYLDLTDHDGDRVTVSDVRLVTRTLTGPSADVVLAVRIDRSNGASLEVHLEESQALALAAFLLRTYRR